MNVLDVNNHLPTVSDAGSKRKNAATVELIEGIRLGRLQAL